MRTTHTIFSKIDLRILRGIAQEKTSLEIADELGFSIRTIENHRSAMLKKANAKTTIGLILFAVDRKIIKIKLRRIRTCNNR
jgi:DNA-binding NarL/FixJ family response regulator